MHKLKHVHDDTSKPGLSYSYLFTLTIAFIAIFDYQFNIQNFTFICYVKVLHGFSTTASSKQKKAIQINALAALDKSAIIDQSADLLYASSVLNLCKPLYFKQFR